MNRTVLHQHYSCCDSHLSNHMLLRTMSICITACKYMLCCIAYYCYQWGFPFPVCYRAGFLKCSVLRPPFQGPQNVCSIFILDADNMKCNNVLGLVPVEHCLTVCLCEMFFLFYCFFLVVIFILCFIFAFSGTPGMHRTDTRHCHCDTL